MIYAVLGTGAAGRTIAAGLTGHGHQVTVGTRDVDATRARPEFAEWAAEHPDVEVATFADAVGGAELVLNATNGEAALEVLAQAGADRLAGKVLVESLTRSTSPRASRPPCSSRTPTRSPSRSSVPSQRPAS